MAGAGILIAAASNNVAKGVCAALSGRNAAGRQNLTMLLALALLGLVPLAI